MQIMYSGSRIAVFTAAKVVEKKIGAMTPNAQFIRLLDERAFTLRIGEDPASLRFGEWSVDVESGGASVQGKGAVAILDAMEHFCSLLPALAEETLSVPYHHECRKTFPVRSIRIDGVPVEEYAVVFIRDAFDPVESMREADNVPEDLLRTGAAEQAANDLCRHLGRQSGAVLRCIPYRDGMPLSRCIVIGSHVPRPYGDWRLYSKDGAIYAEGGDICAMESAASKLAALLTEQEEVALDASTLNESGSLPKREDYLADPRAFIPCYAARFSLPEEELTIREKEKKLEDPETGLFILSHRGEHTYYPENSLEGSLSAWRCGADSSEVDLSRTKDGAFVLLHDETLRRTTDVEEKKGRNGLPDSVLIADWSLAQLRQLRLKDTYGKVTPFPIPTLEELFRACDGRIYLHLDKKFDYEADIFPMMRKLGTYRCLYLCNHLTLEQMPGLRDAFRDVGVRLPAILRIPQQNHVKTKAALKTAVSAADEGSISPAAVLYNDYYKNLPHTLALAVNYGRSLRLASWMMWSADTPLYWREARQNGFGLFMTNFPMLLHEDIV